MKCIVKGNIGADAILRTVGEGENQISVCDFAVAENIGKGDAKKTVWTKVTLWRKYAETMAPLLKKGRYVQVEGNGVVETYVVENTIKARLHINSNVDVDLLDRPAADDQAPWAVAEAEEV